MTDSSEAQLAQERDFLLRSLVDLDDERAAGDIDPDDYEALKDRYTARAGAVLRDLDPTTTAVEPTTEPEPTTARATGVTARTTSATARRANAARGRPRRRSVAVVSMGLLFVIAAGVLVARASGQRLPGAATTGSVTPVGPERQLQQAQADLGNGKYLDAVKLFDAVIREDPRNPEALAYRGWVLRLTGDAAHDPSLVDRGLASVRAAEAADPNYPDAHFFAGEILLRDRQDATGAAGEFRAFLANHPPAAMVPEVQGELDAALALERNPSPQP